MDTDQLALLVSILSVVIALLALNDARKSRAIAKEANTIAAHHSLRPLRLGVYKLMKEFAHYCTTYQALLSLGIVSGTNELMDQRDALKLEIDYLGPLGMPEVEEKATQLMNKAAQLQRTLDRRRGSDPRPLDGNYETLEENINAIVDWFAQEEKGMSLLFKKYLSNA